MKRPTIDSDATVPVIDERDLQDEAYQLGYNSVANGPLNKYDDHEAILSDDIDTMDYLWERDGFLSGVGWQLNRLAGYGKAQDGGYTAHRTVVFIDAESRLNSSPMMAKETNPDELIDLVYHEFKRGLRMAVEHNYPEHDQ